MDERACMSKQISGTSSPFIVTDCLGNFSRGLTAPDCVSEKITEVVQNLLKIRQVVWKNHTEQMTENQIALKLHQVPKGGNTSHIWKLLLLCPEKESLSI